MTENKTKQKLELFEIYPQPIKCRKIWQVHNLKKICLDTFLFMDLKIPLIFIILFICFLYLLGKTWKWKIMTFNFFLKMSSTMNGICNFTLLQLKIHAQLTNFL